MISIIIPFKNSAPFFDECLESIISQSYKNFELILVNDHSTDKSKIIAKKFQLNDHRIILVENKGNGIIDALITGSRIANGQFITRMDSDDLMRQDKLELMRKNLINKGPGHVCIGGVNYFASNKELQEGYVKYSNWINNLTFNENNYSEIFKECTIPSPCWMIFSSDFLKINGFEDLNYPEDYDFAFKLWKNNIKPISVKEKIHLWRDHPQRTSRICSTYDFENFISIKVKYLKEIELKTNESLVVWGAGKKGKRLVSELIKKNIEFDWITENTKKIHQNIYGIILKEIIHLNQNHKKLVIVSISDPSFKIPNNDKMNRFISFF
tara:strand:+ start:1088 stop:2062 length:975 start_codon:yes stop_codon:yes gene_type:complete